MKYFHAHTPSHSPTPKHLPMPSVAIVTANANDTQLPSLCRLTDTQCNLPMGNPSRVNPNSNHSTLGLSDKHDRVFSFGQQNFSNSTAGLSHPCKTFSDSTAGLSHIFRSFTLIRVFHTHSSILHLLGSFTPIRVFYTHSGLLHLFKSFTPIQVFHTHSGLLHPLGSLTPM